MNGRKPRWSASRSLGGTPLVLDADVGDKLPALLVRLQPRPASLSSQQSDDNEPT